MSLLIRKISFANDFTIIRYRNIFLGLTEMYQVGMVISDAHVAKCVGDFAHRNCSISMETGNLIEDDGPYVCRKGNELP